MKFPSRELPAGSSSTTHRPPMAMHVRHDLLRWCAAAWLGSSSLALHAQSQAVPRVSVPTRGSTYTQGARAFPQSLQVQYPWKKFITATVFWVGEQPTDRNPTPNDKSSWDRDWLRNFGGYDDPDPANRIASHASGDFRPRAFLPKLNPFYVALPYNDVEDYRTHKREAAAVIPWFRLANPQPGKTVCKGRWIEIFHNGRSCYAQWEDCGPWTTDDWQYVFGTQPPKTKNNGAAGIDVSPAVRDYLDLKSGEKVHWRFVESARIPFGPWKKYGRNPVTGDPAVTEQQRRMEQLRKLRDEQFMKKPLRQL